MKRAFLYCFIAIAAIIVSAVNVTSAAEAKSEKRPEINFRTETWTVDTASGPLVRRTLMVVTTFPEVPGFTCESWCYENDVNFIGVETIKGGGIEFRHLDRNNPDVVIVTRVTAEAGAVEFVVRAELAKGAKGKLPEKLLTPNLCWQLVKAPDFSSKPDAYPDFVKRCFIFTEKGRTFLNETTRKPIPCRSADDEYNNPPWVQMYVGTWQEIPKAVATSWADTSPDRYTATVIGTVSRDGKYLTALANDTSTLMCQAWHDCMHNNANWAPAEAAPEDQRWRVKLYVMENDPDKLLARVAKDFPNAIRHNK